VIETRAGLQRYFLKFRAIQMRSLSKRLLPPSLAAGLALAAASPARAAFWDDWQAMREIVPRHYVCHRASAPVTVDGKLDDAAWQNAPWTEDFVDIEGAKKPVPRFRTRAKLLWDDQYLYIAAELEEPDLWATLTKHDSVIFNDPDFEIFIDPNGDSLEYYEFEMNALNTSWDLLLKKPYKDGGPPVDGWDIAGLKTGVQVHGTLNHPGDKDEGWTIEVAFPWKALAEYAGTPAPPRPGDQWRLGFSRVEWDIKVEDWIWSPQGIIDMHRPEQWGYLQFSDRETAPDKFVPDPAWPAKRALQAVYYAQKDFFAANHRWARDLGELAAKTGYKSEPAAVRLALDAEGFTASATAPGPDGTAKTWHIRQDSRVWSD
jgi:hypothetical protein